MINSIGLENVGVEGFREQKLPLLRKCGHAASSSTSSARRSTNTSPAAPRSTRSTASRAGDERLAARTSRRAASNSAPIPTCLRDLVQQCRAVIKKPLIIKLTPNTTDVVALAKACDGRRRRRPVRHQHALRAWPSTPANGGRASPRRSAACRARPSSRSRCAWSTRLHARHARRADLRHRRHSRRGEDVVEFLLAGASTVQVGTQSFAEPHAAARIRDELVRASCAKKKSGRARAVGGSARRPLTQRRPLSNNIVFR